MESSSNYTSLDYKRLSIISVVGAPILMLLSVSMASVVSYNPICLSLAFSFGSFIFAFILLLYSKFSQQGLSIDFPSPLTSGIILGLFQISTMIAYFYNPVNHGEVTTMLCTSLIFPLASKGFGWLQYLGATSVIIGLAVTFYLTHLLWLYYSFGYTVISVLLVGIWFFLDRKDSGYAELFIFFCTGFVINIVAVLMLMVLGIYPLDEEPSLMILGVLSGLAFAYGLYLVLISYEKTKVAMGLCSIGFIQVFLEEIIFGLGIMGQLFFPTLPVFLGLELIAIASCFSLNRKTPS